MAFVEKKLNDLVEEDANEPAFTKDGQPVQLFANADSPEEVITAINSSCEGVGLFRTEALFLRKNEMPSEEIQFSNYRELVETANPLSVTIRTLDLGGDKVLNLSGKEKENNPFMGFRAIRYCLQNPEIFMQQLKAILRASAFGKIKLLFPMVSGVGEVIRAKVMLNRAKDELTEQKIDFDESIEIGWRLKRHQRLRYVIYWPRKSIFNVGTNDLVQYLLGLRATIRSLIFLSLTIRLWFGPCNVSRVAQNSGRPITVWRNCGRPSFSSFVVGIGLNHLSCAPPLLKELKFFARRFTQSECEALVDSSFHGKTHTNKGKTKGFYDYRVPIYWPEDCSLECYSS